MMKPERLQGFYSTKVRGEAASFVRKGRPVEGDGHGFLLK